MCSIKYSIIIPHYNSIDLLIKLFSTIPDTKDIEVIVVDDNSSTEIENIKKYIHERNNIKMFINDSGKKGAGSCRNIGLKKASGKWLLFADSDDFFLPEWKTIVGDYYDTDADMVYFAPHGVDLKTGEESKRHHLYRDLVYKYIDSPTVESKVNLQARFCTPWSKMIRKSMVDKNGFIFDEVMASNDIMFITKCAFAAEKIAADKRNIYCVTRGGTSLTSKKDKEKFMSRVDVVIRRYNYLKDILPKKEFEYVHIDRYALGKLADVILEGWGIKTFFEILKLYIENGVAFFDIGLLNPCTILSLAKYELNWWIEIRKHRKREVKQINDK